MAPPVPSLTMTGPDWSPAAVHSGKPLGSTARAGVSARNSATTSAAQTRAGARGPQFMSVSMMGKEKMDRRGLYNPSIRLAVVSGGAQVQSFQLSNLADSARSGSSDET